MDVLTQVFQAQHKGRKEWAPGAEGQLDRLMNIIQSQNHHFVLNGDDHAIYIGSDRYENMNGLLCTLDVDRLALDVDRYIEEWKVPTTGGFEVDIWLL